MSLPAMAVRTAAVAALMGGLACDDPTHPDAGAIEVHVITSGADPDFTGYRVRIGAGLEREIGNNGTIRFTNVAPGRYDVTLVGVAPNCTATGEPPGTVTVQARRTVSISFTINCRSRYGSAWVTATTSGVQQDTDGYRVVVGNFLSHSESSRYVVSSNGAVFLPRLYVGRHRLTLTDVLPNCDSPEGLDRELMISSADTSAVVFNVVCAPATPLAFVRFDNTGQSDIAVINSNRAGFRLLTSDPAWDGDPAWSPDGTRIAFATDRDGNREIYVIDQDGSNPVRLTEDAAFDHSPAWSPDGSRIGFVRARLADGASGGIWVMKADGTDPVQLTGHTQDDFADTDPAWSPDGRAIAFTRRRRDDDPAVFVMNADGSDIRRLSALESGAHPAWSPDGTRVVYVARACLYVDYACYDSLVVRDLEAVTQAYLPVAGREPSWSTDGRHIAYAALSCDFYYVECVPAGIDIIRLEGHSTFRLRDSGTGPTWR